MNLQERRISLQNLLNEKINQLNQIEALRVNLTNEIIEIRGKINLLNELINENGKREGKSKEHQGKIDKSRDISGDNG